MEKLHVPSSRGDRKVIERNRRSQMRALYSKLNSLVPHQSPSPREVISVPDQLDEATTYIKKLQIRLEKMKEKKLSLTETDNNYGGSLIINNHRGIIMGSKSPIIEIHQMGSTLSVSVITGLDCQFIFNEFIRILQEEQAEIVNASYSVVQDAVFHTIHCQIGECGGNRAEKISERLRRFVYGSGAF